MLFLARVLYIVFLSIAIFSCCGEGYDCPPADISAVPWEKYEIGDTVTYYSANAINIKFYLDEKERTMRYKGDCVFYSGSGCNCEFCSSSSIISGVNVDSSSTIKQFKITTLGQGINGATFSSVSFYMGKLSGGFLLDNKFLPDTSIFRKDYTFNNIKYDSVAIADYDTLNPYFSNEKVCRTYYHISKGIIGFETRQPNKTYYLKE